MTATPAQTIGPFFGFALPFDGGPDLVPPGRKDAIQLTGRVLDGAGSPVPDALVEIWQTDEAGHVVQQVGSLHRDGLMFTGWGRAATNDLLASRIKIRSLNFMRGRTFLNRYVIIDEAQNLTPKQMKTLVTRAGPGSKIVCLGNVEQIDTPYLSETTSGLPYAVDRFKGWSHCAPIPLRRRERSRMDAYSSATL